MAKRGNLKKPSQSQAQASRIKSPPVSFPNTDSEHPVFCLRYLEDDYGLEQCTNPEKVALINALRERSQMTWKQITMAPRHGLGKENINRGSIKASIPVHITADVENFIAIRFHGKAPIVGYRVENVFRIIWLDTKFNLYKHSK
jgi:hypothetical protein